jgi:hypothetical protein
VQGEQGLAVRHEEFPLDAVRDRQLGDQPAGGRVPQAAFGDRRGAFRLAGEQQGTAVAAEQEAVALVAPAQPQRLADGFVPLDVPQLMAGATQARIAADGQQHAPAVRTEQDPAVQLPLADNPLADRCSRGDVPALDLQNAPRRGDRRQGRLAVRAEDEPLLIGIQDGPAARVGGQFPDQLAGG